MDEKLKNKIIDQYLNTKAGSSKLAQAMIAPIKRQINYSSIAKSMFKEIKMIFDHKDHRVYLDETEFLVTFENNEVMKVSFDFKSVVGLEGNPVREEILDLIKTYQIIDS